MSMPTGETERRTDGRTPDRYITLCARRVQRNNVYNNTGDSVSSFRTMWLTGAEVVVMLLFMCALMYSSYLSVQRDRENHVDISRSVMVAGARRKQSLPSSHLVPRKIHIASLQESN